MNPRTLTTCGLASAITWIFCAAVFTHAEPPKSGPKTKPIEAKHRVAVEIARERAETMHNLYESTLHVMHRFYFRNERATVPARALEEVFDEMSENTRVEARWISVNSRAMSIDHEPETDFEKQAAREIGKGVPQVELIENGVYHRATAIPLSAGCIGCHNGLLAPPPKHPLFAGLIISIPLNTAEPASPVAPSP